MPSIRIAILALTLAVPGLSGCGMVAGAMQPEAEVPAVGIASTAGMPGALEPIHAAAFTRDLAVFRVSSNGCTDRDDIRPVVTRLPDRDAVITLGRIADDDCKALDEDGIEMIWSFEELGLTPGEMVEVNNPYLLPDTNPDN